MVRSDYTLSGLIPGYYSPVTQGYAAVLTDFALSGLCMKQALKGRYKLMMGEAHRVMKQSPIQALKGRNTLTMGIVPIQALKGHERWRRRGITKCILFEEVILIFSLRQVFYCLLHFPLFRLPGYHCKQVF